MGGRGGLGETSPSQQQAQDPRSPTQTYARAAPHRQFLCHSLLVSLSPASLLPMSKSVLGKPEVMAAVAEMYLNGGLPPREILQRLSTEHGTVVTSDALRSHLVRSGLTARRKQIDAELSVQFSPEKVALARQEKAQACFERWAEQSEIVGDKAMAAAVDAKTLRDLAVATATANQAVRLHQLVTGSNGPSAAGVRINVNFANDPDESPFHPKQIARAAAEKEAKRQAAISISVTEVPGSPEPSAHL